MFYDQKVWELCLVFVCDAYAGSMVDVEAITDELANNVQQVIEDGLAKLEARYVLVD